MKIKINLIDDNGKEFFGETELKPTTDKSTTEKHTTEKHTAEKPSTRGGPKIQLKKLVDENFFQTPKTSKNILDEMKNRSYRYKSTDLTKPLQDLTRDQILRRISLKDDKGKIKLNWVNW